MNWKGTLYVDLNGLAYFEWTQEQEVTTQESIEEGFYANDRTSPEVSELVSPYN